jgi:hypothetical protein
MISVLEPCIGVTATRARNLLPSVRPEVDVPFEAAISVFDDVDVPRWHERCKKALPNFEAPLTRVQGRAGKPRKQPRHRLLEEG